MNRKLHKIGDIGSLYYETKIDNREKYQRGVLSKSKIKRKKDTKILSRRLIKPVDVNFDDLLQKETESKQSKTIVTNEQILNRKLLEIRSGYEEEIRKHGEQTSIKEGFVYMLSNPSFPGWIKAGMSIDYEKRLNIYNQYDPEGLYSFISVRWTNNRRQSEDILLKTLAVASDKRKGEWFKIDETNALNIFYSM